MCSATGVAPKRIPVVAENVRTFSWAAEHVEVPPSGDPVPSFIDPNFFRAADGHMLLGVSFEAVGATDPLPIIDMHLHALAADEEGPPPVVICAPYDSMPIRAPGATPDEYMQSFLKTANCSHPIWSAKDNDALREESLAALQRYNIIAVTSGEPDLVRKWHSADPQRIIPAIMFGIHDAPTTASLRALYKAGMPKVMGEIVAQYDGSGTYAKDNARAYFESKPIPGSDSRSFVALSDLNYGRDKNDIYILGSAVGACDPNSFQWLKNRWQVDSKCAYWSGTKLSDAHVESFIVLNEWYAKDSEHAFSSVSHKAIEGADSPTFRLAEGPCSVCARDRSRCYNAGAIASCDFQK